MPGFLRVQESRSLERRSRISSVTARSLKACRSQGNTNCKVVVWFETCGAYAASKKYYGYGFGKTKPVAVKKAVEMCGNKNCKPVISECE